MKRMAKTAIKSAGDMALCEEWLHMATPPQALNRANNCYSYAVGNLDSILDVQSRGHAEATPQPGDSSGTPKSILLLLKHRTLPFWINMAERDGLRRLDLRGDEPLPRLPPQRRLVVLTYSTRARDYHWLRREQNGLWTYKPDSIRPPTWYDEQRQLISDPRHAALWDYNTAFVFFTIPVGGIEVRMRKDWRLFFNSLDDAAFGNLEALRLRLGDLAQMVKDEFAVFADYLVEMARNGADSDLRTFWKHLREGTRLPNADGLLNFSPDYAHVPLNFAWSVSTK
jgi:hypothetical protein